MGLQGLGLTGGRWLDRGDDDDDEVNVFADDDNQVDDDDEGEVGGFDIGNQLYVCFTIFLQFALWIVLSVLTFGYFTNLFALQFVFVYTKRKIHPFTLHFEYSTHIRATK